MCGGQAIADSDRVNPSLSYSPHLLAFITSLLDGASWSALYLPAAKHNNRLLSNTK